MPAGSIVEDPDVVEDVGAGEIAGLYMRWRTRSFFRLLKKFSHGIVPAVSASTHSGLQVVGVTEAAPIVTAVLGPLV